MPVKEEYEMTVKNEVQAAILADQIGKAATKSK